MKDEELAEEFANNGYALGCTKTPFESAKEGFLAGLKAGRPQWHDLRKDPNDLPKCKCDVLDEMETHSITIADTFIGIIFSVQKDTL